MKRYAKSDAAGRTAVRALVVSVFSGAVSFALYLLQPVVPEGDLFLVFEVSCAPGQQYKSTPWQVSSKIPATPLNNTGKLNGRSLIIPLSPARRPGPNCCPSRLGITKRTRGAPAKRMGQPTNGPKSTVCGACTAVLTLRDILYRHLHGAAARGPRRVDLSHQAQMGYRGVQEQGRGEEDGGRAPCRNGLHTAGLFV